MRDDVLKLEHSSTPVALLPSRGFCLGLGHGAAGGDPAAVHVATVISGRRGAVVGRRVVRDICERAWVGAVGGGAVGGTRKGEASRTAEVGVGPRRCLGLAAALSLALVRGHLVARGREHSWWFKPPFVLARRKPAET